MEHEHKWAVKLTALGDESNQSKTAAESAYERGEWLPTMKLLNKFLQDFMDEQEKMEPVPLAPEIQEFQEVVEKTPRLRYLVAQMIEQIPLKYAHLPHSGRVTDFYEMVRLLNLVIRKTPYFHMAVPMNAILDWWMGTSAGAVFFLEPEINDCIKKILQTWCQFLNSPESMEQFEKNGWTTKEAQDYIKIEEYEYDMSKPNGGYNSWNSFFIRKFKEGRRPIESPDDPTVIIAPCEARPYDVQIGVRKEDTFWIKRQFYSVQQVLAGHHVDQFVGGDIYQGFLNAYNYHRWHSPVDGKLVDAWVQPGAYFAEAPSVGFDPAGPNRSQGYLAHSAAKAIFFIEAEGGIGLMAIIFIGMGEVSSNVITAKPGSHLKKGEEIGYFQFGGSSYVMVFQPGVIESFYSHALPSPHSQVIKLHSKVAKAHRK